MQVESIGTGKGKGYTCNVPLQAGIRDQPYLDLFRPIADAAREAFAPAAIVLQCGADALTRDPLGELNLTTDCFAAVVRHVQAWQLPLLILGGGAPQTTPLQMYSIHPVLCGTQCAFGMG